MQLPVVPRSPTSTADWLRCPMYAHLRREGWTQRGVAWTPNRLLGTAIGDALSTLYRGESKSAAKDKVELVTRLGYMANDTWDLSALTRLATRGYERAAADRLHEAGEVLMVDDPLPSRARPDLVQRVPGQGLVVTDTKVTLKGGEDRLSEYYTSHQLFHYAWEVGEVLQEPVAWVRIHLVTLTPVQTYLHPIQVTPARLAFWLRGAERAWRGMSEEPAPDFTACQSKWGPCEYIPACHVLNLDPDAMESAYVKELRVSQA